jgi:microcin C transport system substrate-binding protein
MDLNSMDLKERRLSIKFLLRAFAAAAVILLLPLTAATAQDESPQRVWRHGTSLFGDLKYPQGFKHFDYVNPDAPKGGVVRLSTIGTFDNFNPVAAGVKGVLGLNEDFVFSKLMANSLDEVASGYGLIAESVSYPDDYSSVSYRLRPAAKWDDGEPVTPEDVIFSFNAFKTNHPFYAAYYQHVVKAEKTGEHEVTFTFDMPGNRELPQIVGEIHVLPKHWFEGTDKAGKKRNVADTTLEPPVSNGPYRIKEFVAGRSIVYQRVKDYWGKDLPVNVGSDNLDEIRYEFYRDTVVALEAFKADQVDFRQEGSAKNWATAYDFPAVKDKRVILEEFPILNSGDMQAFVFNTRRAKFGDPRLRHAFDLVFDFEEMNKQLFFGQYHRIKSYFEGTELASSGLPSGRELEILEAVRGEVPPEVFTTEYKSPVNGSPEAVRANLRDALRLLREAGYEVRNQKLVNAKTGEPLSVEFLDDDPSFERVALFYKPALERLGVTVTVRTVDGAQMEERMRNWDYDILTVASFPQSLSPGNEQREYWGSKAADTLGSHNLIGVKDPAVDKLIDHVIFAKDRDDLVAATHALDRVLLWHHFVIPQWTYGKVRTARWDRYSHPDVLPKYGRGAFPTVWWFDPAKAAKTEGRP